MIFDRKFRDAFLKELAKKAKEESLSSVSTYNVIYNMIKNKKIQITFNTALLKHNSKNGLASTIGGMRKKKDNDNSNDYERYRPDVKYHDRPELSERILNVTNPLNIGRSALRLARKGVANAIDIATGWDYSASFKVSGGYDPNRKIINIVAWWYMGFEFETYIFENVFKKIYSMILGLILHEGIYLYNFKSNGNSFDDRIQNWYKHYFINSMMQYTGRSTVSKFCGNYLGEYWPRYMFDNIEKYVVNGENIPIREKIVTDFNKSPLLRTPLIEQHIKKSPINMLLKKELPERYDLDVETLDSVNAYFKDFIEFVGFMYTNRNKTFEPSQISEVPAFDYFIKNFDNNTGWKDKCLGFKIVGDKDVFNAAYDDIYDLKDPYDKPYKTFFKKTNLYSEMYMPTSIQAKLVYYSAIRNIKLEDDHSNIRLIDYAMKGVSSL